MQRDLGNAENGHGGGRCLSAASLSHNRLKPLDQVQLCSASSSLPKGNYMDQQPMVMGDDAVLTRAREM